MIVSNDLERLNRQKELDNEEKKNKRFVQIPILMEANLIRPSSLKLFLALVEITFDEKYPSMTETAYCVVDLDTLKIRTGLSKKTIILSTKELVEQKWIKIFKTGSYNVYAINPSKAWGSGADKRWRALYHKNDLQGFTVRGNIYISNTKE